MPGQWTVEADSNGKANARGKEAEAQTRHLDPYFRWAEHTEWRGYAHLCGLHPDSVVQTIQIIARANNQADRKRAMLSGADNPLCVPVIYQRAAVDGAEPALHFTASLPWSQRDWLRQNPCNLDWKLALPVRDAEQLAKAVPNGLFGETRDGEDMRARNLLGEALAQLPESDPPEVHDGLLALIDFGCPFLNQVVEARTDDGTLTTRVAAVWDQGGAAHAYRPRWPWREPSAFGGGRQLGPRALQIITATARGARRLEETAVYRSIDYLIDYEDPRRRIHANTHGGHLLDVLGGKPDPLTRSAKADFAAAAPLVFVQLPFAAAMDSTGSSLAPHLLDGVRYAMELCKKDKPLVVSISYGGQAGPHDGSSIIETAFDELLQLRDKNFAVVLAAGNARRSQCHAHRVLRKNRSVLLRVEISENDTTDTHVEVWYLPPVKGARVEFRVRSPQRQWSDWLDPGTHGQGVLMHDVVREGDIVATLRHDVPVRGGQRALALLSLAPTLQPADVDAAAADAGVWEIEAQLIGGGATAAVKLDAWVERDDPARGSPAHAPFFVDQQDGDDLNTMSSIATGKKTLRVGAFNRGTGRCAAYSAPGVGSRRPQLLAASEEDSVTPSIAAAATRSGETLRMNGTSVSAPVMARRLFNFMVANGAALPNAQLLKKAEKLAAGDDPNLRPTPDE